MTPPDFTKLFAKAERILRAAQSVTTVRQALREAQMDEAYSDREPDHDPMIAPTWKCIAAWALVLGIPAAIGAAIVWGLS